MKKQFYSITSKIWVDSEYPHKRYPKVTRINTGDMIVDLPATVNRITALRLRKFQSKMPGTFSVRRIK